MTLRAVAIVAIGAAIGLADSSLRPVKVRVDAAESPEQVLRRLGAAQGGGQTSSEGVQALRSAEPGEPGAESRVDAPASGGPAVAAAEGAQGDAAKAPATPVVKALPENHITIAQGKALFDAGAQFIDARIPADYEAGHVARAYRMALSDFRAGTPEMIEFMDRAAPVVVYCGGGNCDESEAVARQLNNLGFTTVYIMHDGFPGWRDAGHQVETGAGQ